jgi:ATP-dependent helicase Lhr and Lhr-like helicase
VTETEPKLPWATHPRLRAAVERRGFKEFTEIQQLSFGLGQRDADLLLISPTGTGKTEAALFPVLARQLSEPSPPISILYITPLRALNRDLEQRLLSLVEEVGLTAAVRHGDTSTQQRTKQSRRPPDLLMTTPETLQLLLVGQRLRQGLKNVRTVIIDEIHELAPSDRGAQLALSLERLDDWVGRPVRRVALSATIGNPDEVARFIAPEPRRIDVRQSRQPRRIVIDTDLPGLRNVEEDATLAGQLKADPLFLSSLRSVEDQIRAHRTTLVFVNTRPTAEGVAARLQRMAPDLAIAVHHGSLSRDVREEAEVAFRKGELRALVATSSLELGIDIGSVDLVVQFGSPHQASRLLQRVGRSGHRVGREVRGLVVAFDEEDLEEATVLARRAMAGEIEPTRWRRRNRLALAQQIIAELRARGDVESNPLFERFHHAAPASELTDAEWQELLTYLAGLGLVRQEGARIRSGRATLDRFYSTLSLIPDERTYRLRDIATRKPIGTLDERFVLTQVLGQPDQLFLLHGRTWKIVEFRDEELLVENVAELGVEPRWVGEDLPVPYDVAQEIGRLRREGDLSGYPLSDGAREKLAARLAVGRALPAAPNDRQITVTGQGRLAIFGACFGTRTNETLALATAGLLTARLGARVDVLSIEPTWFVLGLPIAVDDEGLRQALMIAPETLDGLLNRLVPTSLEYRWVFLTVARKFGVLPASVNPKDLRSIEPLLDRAQDTPLGEEALEKALFERYDVDHARLVLERIRDGGVEIVATPPNPWSDLPLARLKWQELPDIPPPTLLKAIEERLRKEPLTLICLRCGFTRTTTTATYVKDGGNQCRLCHGALSAILSPQRTAEIEQLVKYAKRKWKGKRPPRSPAPTTTALVRQAYSSAELLANYGERALLCFAAHGVGPDTARRLLSRLYRDEPAFFTEILRAERSYARTRAFWD